MFSSAYVKNEFLNVLPSPLFYRNAFYIFYKYKIVKTTF